MTLAFLIVALILFILAAVGAPIPSRFNLIAAGLAFYMAALIFGQVR